ncbi:phosphoribosylanthranilate isomerase [Marinicella meishanensis]|uniref:phosphoribosylanthranilate isomerase n=1 Tax=Marinicella meishanensis TaxID=2873263 RepID=UPI001CBEEDB5|nr:phosphoribosylanthranilate isomerase [Marinicella sp. NBU2979]
MKPTRVKYCGLKTADEVAAAIDCGVAAVGFVFVEASPRYITAAQAAPLIQQVQQAGIQAVALFADHTTEAVLAITEQTQPDVLQFHGQETPEFCEHFDRPYWKAVPMLSLADPLSYMAQYPSANAFLLDAFGGTQMGGSGQAFMWSRMPQQTSHTLILAGGIKPENVQQALHETGANYIDTSSGIESAPGVKSAEKMQALMQAVRAFDQNHKNH